MLKNQLDRLMFVFLITGLQWIQAKLVITGSGAGSYRHAHDREGRQRWHLGGAAELSLSNIVDADTRESL